MTGSDGGAGWRARRVVTTLRVGSGLEVLQEWSIVADGVLDELVIGTVLDARAEVTALYGVEVVGQAPHPSGAAGRSLIVRLPEPILPGDVHAFALQAAVAPAVAPAGEVSAYVDVVSAPCAVLQTRAKFLSPCVPRRFCRLERVTMPARPRAVRRPDWTGEDGASGWDPLPGGGEVELIFTDVHPLRAYGLAWAS